MLEDINGNPKDNLIFRLGKLVEEYPECDWLQEFAEQNGIGISGSLLEMTVEMNSLRADGIEFYSEN